MFVILFSYFWSGKSNQDVSSECRNPLIIFGKQITDFGISLFLLLKYVNFGVF